MFSNLPAQWWKLGDAGAPAGEFGKLRFDLRDFAAVTQPPGDPGYAYAQSWNSGAAPWHPGDLTYTLAMEVGDSGTQFYNDLTAWGRSELMAGSAAGNTYLFTFDAGYKPQSIIVKEAPGKGRVYALLRDTAGVLAPVRTDEVLDGFGESGFLDRFGWLIPFVVAAGVAAAQAYFGTAAAAPVGEVVPGALTAVETGEVIAAGATAAGAGTATTAAATAAGIPAATVATGGFVTEAAKAVVTAGSSAFKSFDLGKFTTDLAKLYAAYELQQRAGAKTSPPKSGTTQVLPDGSILRVNPDGSTTITRPDGTVTTVGVGGIMPGVAGGMPSQLIPGVSNQTLLIGAGLAVLLFALTKRKA